VLTDSWYYLMLDVETMQVRWKRQIDSMDTSREPRLRFELKGDYLAVLKEDFDLKAIYMLSSRTGDVLWRTDPKKGKRPPPMHSMLLVPGLPDPAGGEPAGARLYGIRVHPGQGFYLACMDARTGKDIFTPREEEGYTGVPAVTLEERLFGETLVIRVKDRQDFELGAFGARDGARLYTLKGKGTGDFGQAGRVSYTVQSGGLALFGNNTLSIATGEKAERNQP
jgi:hypothetical protein